MSAASGLEHLNRNFRFQVSLALESMLARLGVSNSNPQEGWATIRELGVFSSPALSAKLD